MKISPKNYAAGLIESLDEKADAKVLAKKFWQILQKNKQYKDLPKILAELDVEYAKRKDMVLAHVYSEKELKEQEIKDISKKIKEKYQKETLIRNVIDANLKAGVVVKIDDKEIDLSVEGRVTRLKKSLIK